MYPTCSYRQAWLPAAAVAAAAYCATAAGGTSTLAARHGSYGHQEHPVETIIDDHSHIHIPGVNVFMWNHVQSEDTLRFAASFNW